MKRITVFHGDGEKYVQAVICEDKKDYFEELGFVDDVSKLSSGISSKEEMEVMYYRDKIEKMTGEKPHGRTGVDALRAMYNKAKGAAKGTPNDNHKK